MWMHIMFSSVWVAEWLSFGKELFSICSLCILTFCDFIYFKFWI